MADIGSTASALAMTAASVIYPNGLSPVTGSVTGTQTIVRRGWPTQPDFSGACGMTKGIDLVSVMPIGGAFRPLSEPLGWPWETISQTAATVTLTADGNTLAVAIAGGVTPAGLVGATLTAAPGSVVQPNVAISYIVQSVDTADTIAAALAGQIPEAYSSGATATFPGVSAIAPVTGGTATARRVVRRQRQMFSVSVWSISWQRRDALGLALDAGLAGTNWIANTDGTESQIVGAGAIEVDGGQNQGIYRRDLRYWLEFDTVQTMTAPQMMFGIGMSRVVTQAGVVLQPFAQTAPTAGIATDTNGDVLVDAGGNLIGQVQQPYAGLFVNSGGYVLQDGSGNLAGDPA